jgi:hypothetical protein
MNLLTHLAPPGTGLLAAKATEPELAVHAMRREDGRHGILLINKSPTRHFNVRLDALGARVGTEGERFSYGPDSDAVVRRRFTAQQSPFEIWVAPYTMEAVVMN